MSIISESIFVESKTLRQQQLEELNDERSLLILNKVKTLLVALWKDKTRVTTTEEIASYYEVESSVVRHASKKHRDEFLSDGWRQVRGVKNLKALRSIGSEVFSLPSATTRVAIWTPRAALRLGMLLRDSEVAKEVRTSLLNAVEKVIPAQTQEEAQERLMAASSALAIINPSLPALVLGKPEAVVTKTEVVEKTVLVNERGRSIATYEGLSKTKLAKRYGLKKAADLVEWLKSIDKLDLLK
ncbi:MAG: DNA-binding protein, partial [Xenococcaceae cyanobacterium]